MEDIRHDNTHDNETVTSQEQLANAAAKASSDNEPAIEAPVNAFHERIGAQETGDFYDEDFINSIDPEQNPHITDQLEDENLQHEAESDYR